MFKIRWFIRAALMAVLALIPAAQSPAAQKDREEPSEQQSQGPAAGPGKKELKVSDWLDISYAVRFRYETVSNRFKLGETGGDQQVPNRNRIGLEIKKIIDPVRFSFEFEHSDAFLTDAGSTLNATMIDRHDILQAFVSLVFNQEAGARYPSTLSFGRQSFDLGSRRLFARNRYRNTANRWDGFRWSLGDPKRWTLDTFVLQPVALRMDEMDRRFKGVYFWGSYFSRPLTRGRSLDIYYFHLHESADTATRRHHATIGGRFYRDAEPGAFGYEIESAIQFGKVAGQDHLAQLQHFQLGYTFDVPWQPSIMGAWDYASGDGDPADDSNDTFDTLGGARRWEYGPTGILNWMYRSNINSPDVHLRFKPAKKLDLLPAIRWLWLAEAKSPWVGTGLRDTSGGSGTYVGSLMEVRVRYNFAQYFRPEIGYARFFKGSYTRTVPQSPATGDSNYFYLELELQIADLLP